MASERKFKVIFRGALSYNVLSWLFFFKLKKLFCLSASVSVSPTHTYNYTMTSSFVFLSVSWVWEQVSLWIFIYFWCNFFSTCLFCHFSDTLLFNFFLLFILLCLRSIFVFNERQKGGAIEWKGMWEELGGKIIIKIYEKKLVSIKGKREFSNF